MKDVSRGKTEKQDYKSVDETIIKKLGDCKETQNEDGKFAALMVGIKVKTPVKAAKVLLCSQGIIEDLFLSSLQARNCIYPSLEKFNDFPMSTNRSGLEWGYTPAIGLVGIDIVPCEE